MHMNAMDFSAKRKGAWNRRCICNNLNMFHKGKEIGRHFQEKDCTLQKLEWIPRVLEKGRMKGQVIFG